MGKVVYDISMSLDGFITAAGQTPLEPMGAGGQRLHDWAFGDDERDREVLSTGLAGTGAVITGRRNYTDALPWWGADGPTGPARLPIVVLCHEIPADPPPPGGVYTFVTGGVEQALKQAREAAGDKDVTVMGGAETGRQFLAAGLVDEISIHLVPVVLGGGTPMFTGGLPVELENIGSLQTAAATHLRFRVRR
ncbi:MAG TPA: dihydrofolate reductase family protein [Mycobacteriales bacterium]|jgi:dihydrofolate reductase|nr:dihydrofolate reductase family protein [Mycobacteriales bacterium]